MKRMAYTAVWMAVLGLSAGAASAQSSIAKLSCSSASSDIAVNISYYNIGITNALNIGSQSSGAGAGKVTFMPGVLHASLSNFDTFAKLASAGTSLGTCTLRATTRTGSTLELELALVVVKSAYAVVGEGDPGSNTRETAYTEVDIEYGGLRVKTSTGSDNGGTGSPTSGGWNRVTNKSDSSSTPIS